MGTCVDWLDLEARLKISPEFKRDEKGGGRFQKASRNPLGPPPDSALKVVVGWGMPSIRTSYWREFAASTRRCESRFAGKFVGRWSFSRGEDSATGQCEASFQQTRTNLCSTSGDAQVILGRSRAVLYYD